MSARVSCLFGPGCSWGGPPAGGCAALAAALDADLAVVLGCWLYGGSPLAGEADGVVKGRRSPHLWQSSSFLRSRMRGRARGALGLCAARRARGPGGAPMARLLGSRRGRTSHRARGISSWCERSWHGTCCCCCCCCLLAFGRHALLHLLGSPRVAKRAVAHSKRASATGRGEHRRSNRRAHALAFCCDATLDREWRCRAHSVGRA